MTETIRIVLADDHPIVRAGLSPYLSIGGKIELVGEATNVYEACRLTLELSPDVLLLDLVMPGPAPLEAVAMVRRTCPGVKLMILTGHDEDIYVRMLVGGVEGYVFKDENPDDIIEAIYTIAHGGTWFSQSVITKLIRWKKDASKRRDGIALSSRELDILRLAVDGLTDQEISQELGLSDRTVRYHFRFICSKLRVKTRAEAIALAVRLKLFEDKS